MKCTSCHVNVKSEQDFTRFRCPACGKTDIIRCKDCRRKSTIYVCPKCGFEGP